MRLTLKASRGEGAIKYAGRSNLGVDRRGRLHWRHRDKRAADSERQGREDHACMMEGCGEPEYQDTKMCWKHHKQNEQGQLSAEDQLRAYERGHSLDLRSHGIKLFGMKRRDG